MRRIRSRPVLVGLLLGLVVTLSVIFWLWNERKVLLGVEDMRQATGVTFYCNNQGSWTYLTISKPEELAAILSEIQEIELGQSRGQGKFGKLGQWIGLNNNVVIEEPMEVTFGMANGTEVTARWLDDCTLVNLNEGLTIRVSPRFHERLVSAPSLGPGNRNVSIRENRK